MQRIRRGLQLSMLQAQPTPALKLMARSSPGRMVHQYNNTSKGDTRRRLFGVKSPEMHTHLVLQVQPYVRAPWHNLALLLHGSVDVGVHLLTGSVVAAKLRMTTRSWLTAEGSDMRWRDTERRECMWGQMDGCLWLHVMPFGWNRKQRYCYAAAREQRDRVEHAPVKTKQATQE